MDCLICEMTMDLLKINAAANAPELTDDDCLKAMRAMKDDLCSFFVEVAVNVGRGKLGEGIVRMCEPCLKKTSVDFTLTILQIASPEEREAVAAALGIKLVAHAVEVTKH